MKLGLNPHPEESIQSRPARGAWIETVLCTPKGQGQAVAPREGRVD